MTDPQRPITPSFELMDKWWRKACRDPYYGGSLILPKAVKVIATEAVSWGADQELEACCEWLDFYAAASEARDLRAARRPKPPSLKKQAYNALDTYIYGEPDPKDKERTYNTIRRALEALPND